MRCLCEPQEIAQLENLDGVEIGVSQGEEKREQLRLDSQMAPSTRNPAISDGRKRGTLQTSHERSFARTPMRNSNDGAEVEVSKRRWDDQMALRTRSPAVSNGRC